MGQTRSEHPGGCYFTFNWSFERATAARLVEAVTLAHIEGYDRVDLLLSSTGGFLMDTHYAVESLVALPLKLVLWNMSSVQSAANMLFALGVERYATPGSTFFFHQTGFEGVAGQRSSEVEIRKQLRDIELGDQRSAAFVAERTKVPLETILGWQKAGQTLSAEEAMAAGLVHDVRRPDIPPNAFVRQILPNYPA